MTSLIRTCQKQGRDFTTVAVALLRSRVPVAVPLVKPRPPSPAPFR